MSYFSNISGARSMTNASNAAEKDVELTDPPTDSISSVSFSSQTDYLAVGSWDNSVRIYEVGPNGQSRGKALYSHQGPVLGVCWSKGGTQAFSCGADNTARMFETTTGQNVQVAQHDGPVKAVRWVDSPQGGILVTGSWDKSLKYWDLRTPNPVATVQLPERCHTLDVQYPSLVVGTADQQILIYDLKNPTVPYKTKTSPLKRQARVVSCFTNSQGDRGFALGSVEGRLAISYIEDKDAARNYSFKCHRRDSVPNTKDQALVFAVNDISFHPVHGTFSTCGSDGTFHFWDGEARVRTKTSDLLPAPISATAFNKDGTIFAYALSYDWHKGHAGMNPEAQQPRIMLHRCKVEEVQRRMRK